MEFINAFNDLLNKFYFNFVYQLCYFNAAVATSFPITDKKQHFTILILSIQDNLKLPQKLESGFHQQKSTWFI